MITFSLQSGSNGNAIYVEAGECRLLFDAGINGKCAAERMAEHGRDIGDVDAVIISHEHSDHVRCAGVYHRKFGVPVYITPRTLSGSSRRCSLGKMTDVRHFQPGDTLEFSHVRVYTIRTPHDAVEGVAFVVEHESKRLGILTDLGHPFAGLESVLADLDAAYLESNYDPEMLEAGPYPPWLKARIRGQRGHLSNGESARLAAASARGRLRWIAAAHLSEQNNEPDIVLETYRAQIGNDFSVHLAQRDGVSELFRV